VREERGRCRGTIGIFFSGETETKIEAAGRLRLKYIVAQYWGGEARDRLLDHQWAKAQSIYGKRSAKARRGEEWTSGGTPVIFYCGARFGMRWKRTSE